MATFNAFSLLPEEGEKGAIKGNDGWSTPGGKRRGKKNKQQAVEVSSQSSTQNELQARPCMYMSRVNNLDALLIRVHHDQQVTFCCAQAPSRLRPLYLCKTCMQQCNVCTPRMNGISDPPEHGPSLKRVLPVSCAGAPLPC